ncbi:MAG TPA: EpsG family protein [Sphingomicrobium sp.]|nr:EpsG family protein [Sphingomicrobium sp.]
MLIYWLLFAFFAVGAFVAPLNLAPLYSTPHGPTPRGPSQFRLAFIVGAIATICMIGLRYRVGPDWDTYAGIFEMARTDYLSAALKLGDPGYEALNWISYQVGADIWLVNLFSAAIFGWGLFRFCSAQPAPWVAAAIAVPYLIIVVAMGYTRQSIALGVLMAGLARQGRGASVLNFAIYVAVAATFHKTAVVVFPLVALAGRGSKFIGFLIAVCASVLLYDSFLQSAVNSLIQNYIDADYSSQGAFVRIAMNLLAAVLLWVFKGKLGFSPHEFKIWRNFAFAAVLFIILFAVIPSSTAVDRMSLYIIPLQLAVLTRVALLGRHRTSGIAGVLLYMFAVQYVWMNFAQHARYWVPYQLYPF